MLKETLQRLNKAMELLLNLLEEEFSALKSREVEKISSLEASIQLLLEQLEKEKFFLKERIQRDNSLGLNDFFATYPQGEEAFLWKSLEEKQHKIHLASKRNSDLAFALARQTVDLLTFLQKKIKDSNRDNAIYNAGGKVQGIDNVRKLRSSF
ncbi:MAG: hypothetical protein PWR24_272 [Desulfonauticus sp.]|nr:MAG: Uncharacterized protein XD41_0391 [Desulfonauticus sp. 38_4375]MDK2920715.1 hypothetical protein [Desulfonauticus sp.]